MTIVAKRLVWHHPTPALDGTVPDRYTPSAMSHTTTTEPSDTLPPADAVSSVAARQAHFHRSRLIVVLLACILLALAWLLTPTLRWAYDIERAGRLMDVGLVWPTPRQVAS